MRIALAGLATSHPYTDARTLSRHAELVVWEQDQERLARFTAEHPRAKVAGSLEEALSGRLDGVVLTVPNPQVPEALGKVLETGLPCFVNKPAAAARAQLEQLDRLPIHDRVLSCSVLRFAPAFADVRADRGELLAVRATVRHDVGLWATGYNAWQDTPGEGGGTMVTMGVHGVELLVALLGPDVRPVGAAGARRHYTTLRSEDTGVMALRWDDGVTGVVEILGVSEPESYSVTLHRRDGSETIVIEPGDDPVRGLGYEGTIEAFLAMAGGAPSPVPWAETRAILDVLVRAREDF
ncbi:Gfo/Idh/MocA family oxidoreductase [Actinomadura sp. ATCC 31491]|uniref:Gfo/Idh/MocA family oxidoreductase n=1 Tax=Actinomadura luzonensis TaxID=2805427 RepID=A0ABT0G338_9ACTN|nr:Gfo/Idh/MocA family oxidoreductase [Actinomadura luzonensis]MCK2218536.1 Gfo/Idh/MocA family oxidoreductase [Actinomadura luzonensis]